MNQITLFEKILGLREKFQDTLSFHSGVLEALLNISPEDQAKFFYLDGKVAADVLSMFTKESITEERFYKKVFQENVNDYLPEILEEISKNNKFPSDIGIIIKRKVAALAKSKPLIMTDAAERIKSISEPDLGRMVREITKEKVNPRLFSVSLARRLSKQSEARVSLT